MECDLQTTYILYLTYSKFAMFQGGGVVMVFNGTFNNISVISWWSVLLLEETGVYGENHRLAASH